MSTDPLEEASDVELEDQPLSPGPWQQQEAGMGLHTNFMKGDMVLWTPKEPRPDLEDKKGQIWRIVANEPPDAIIEDSDGAIEYADMNELTLAEGGYGSEEEADIDYERTPAKTTETTAAKEEDKSEQPTMGALDLPINIPTVEGAEISSKQELAEDEPSAVSDDEDALKKLESGIQRDTLIDYHPEIRQSNYDEILTLSSVVRNKKGTIIDPLHRTVPFLTKYERARCLGLRAKQLAHGADPLIEVPEQMIRSETIAVEELRQRRLPYIIRRPLPNGGNEYWKVADLEMLQF